MHQLNKLYPLFCLKFITADFSLAKKKNNSSLKTPRLANLDKTEKGKRFVKTSEMSFIHSFVSDFKRKISFRWNDVRSLN